MGNLSPLALFAATEAIALMLTRVMRERGLETIRLTETGEIRDEQESLVGEEAWRPRLQDFGRGAGESGGVVEPLDMAELHIKSARCSCGLSVIA